jgi:hypothetical protein
MATKPNYQTTQQPQSGTERRNFTGAGSLRPAAPAQSPTQSPAPAPKKSS